MHSSTPVIVIIIFMLFSIAGLVLSIKALKSIKRMQRGFHVNYMRAMVLHLRPDLYHKLPTEEQMINDRKPVFTYLEDLIEL